MRLFSKKQPPQQTSNFWKSKDGTTSKVLLALLALGAGALFFKFSEQIITGLTNLYIVSFLAAGIGIIAYFLSDKHFRASMHLTIKGWVRKATNVWTETNSIAIMEGYVVHLNNKIEQMDSGIMQNSKSLGELNHKIKKIEGEIEDYNNKVTAAKKINNKSIALQYITKVQNRTPALANYKSYQKKIKFLDTMLKKMREYAVITMENIKDKVDSKKDEYEVISNAKKTLKNAYGIVKGNSAEKEIFDKAYEFVSIKIETDLLEMDTMLKDLESQISELDFEKEVNAIAAEKFYEEWDRNFEKKVENNSRILSLLDNPNQLEEVLAMNNDTVSHKDVINNLKQVNKPEPVILKSGSSSNDNNGVDSYFS